MGKYRRATLYPATTATTAKTETIDLDVNTPISRLQIVYKAKSAGTALSAHPAGNVTKIEIVDGSDVITSLTGYEAVGLDFYNNRCMPNSYMSDIDDVYALQTYNINFGRKLWDTVLALDPKKFRQPQLKITHNYRVADTAADDATLAVYAHMFDEKVISPIGYLRATEFYTYTNPANTAVETVDVPRDLPIRQFLVRAACADYYPYQVVNTIKIEENGGAKIPFDFLISDWVKHINQEYPMVLEPAAIAANVTARDIYLAPTMTCMLSLMPITVTNIISREITTTTIPFKVDITASDNTLGLACGWEPHYTFPIPMGDVMDPDDWFNPAGLTALKMKLTSGSAGTSGATQIVAEQLKKY